MNMIISLKNHVVELKQFSSYYYNCYDDSIAHYVIN